MSPIHREGNGTPKAAPTWASLVERLIQEAQERGEFDALPLHGKPLPDWDDERAGEMRLAYHVLRNAGVAPPWIEADKEVRRLLAERDRIFDRATAVEPGRRAAYRGQLVRLVADLDAAVERLNALAPTFEQQRRRPNLDEEVRTLESLPRRDRDERGGT